MWEIIGLNRCCERLVRFNFPPNHQGVYHEKECLMQYGSSVSDFLHVLYSVTLTSSFLSESAQSYCPGLFKPVFISLINKLKLRRPLRFPPPPAFQRPNTSPRIYLPNPARPGAPLALGPAKYPRARSGLLSAYPCRSFHKPALCLRPARRNSHKARPAHKSSYRERRQRLCLGLPGRPLHFRFRCRVSAWGE